jgi:glycosyltransferase involved in cell wall biosynthesis
MKQNAKKMSEHIDMQMRNKILVTPQSSLLKKDKHLELLYNIPIKNGYEVAPFSILKAIRFGRQAIWHIHWIDVFHTGKIRRVKMRSHFALISSARFLNFLVQVFICKLFGVKILWTIHNVASHDRPDSVFEKIVTKLLLVFSDRVSATNNHIKDKISGNYGFSDIFLMRQGLYEGCYANTVTRGEARHKLGLREQDFVIVFLGGIEEYKGIDIAMEALDEVSDDSVKLVVAGRLDRDTEYGSRIHDLAMKNKNIILFDKFIPDDDVQIYFKAADYSIYPYRRIDNSGPIFLTLAFGVPTIIRSAGGIPEVINLNPKVAIEIGHPEKSEIAQAIRKARDTKVEEVEFNVFREKLGWANLEDEILQNFDALQENNTKCKLAPGELGNV